MTYSTPPQEHLDKQHDASPLLAGWRFKAVVIVLLVSAAGYLLVSVLFGWREMLAAIRQFGWTGLAVAISFTAMSLAVRFTRWQLFLSSLDVHLPFFTNLRIYIGGLALTATPGKAGESVRSLFLKRHNVSYMKSLAAFFADRFTDLLAVMLLAAGGVWAIQEARPVALLLLFVICCVLLVIQKPMLYRALARQLTAILPWARLNQLIYHSVDLLLHCNALFRPGTFLLGLLLAIIAWGLEAVNLFFITTMLQVEISFLDTLFIYAFAKLVGAISMIPGGMGSTEATMVALLMLQGVDETAALACAVLLRLTTFWFVVATGMIALPKK